MGAAWIALVFYLLQITIPGTGKLVCPTPKVLWDMMPWRKDKVEVQPRFLMSIPESVESFLFGMARIFMALIVLVSVRENRLLCAWSMNALLYLSASHAIPSFESHILIVDPGLGFRFHHECRRL